MGARANFKQAIIAIILGEWDFCRAFLVVRCGRSVSAVCLSIQTRVSSESSQPDFCTYGTVRYDTEAADSEHSTITMMMRKSNQTRASPKPKTKGQTESLRRFEGAQVRNNGRVLVEDERFWPREVKSEI